jgi:hypothetical protein
MAISVLLQPWITVRGISTTTFVYQSSAHYAEVPECKDVVCFMEVADISSTPCNFNYQTSPSLDDSMFQIMQGTFQPVVGLNLTINRYATAAVPLARYVRWWISGSTAAAWSITFRVWLSCTLSRARQKVAVAGAIYPPSTTMNFGPGTGATNFRPAPATAPLGGTKLLAGRS